MRKLLYATAGTVALGGATTAQTADIIEEVVVTAQKHAQNVNDIPIAINAFTGERLAEQGVVTTENIAILRQDSP
ncbi:MAG: hypothetical protein R3E84_11925 [Pseudomonadales bacterium]